MADGRWVGVGTKASMQHSSGLLALGMWGPRHALALADKYAAGRQPAVQPNHSLDSAPANFPTGSSLSHSHRPGQARRLGRIGTARDDRATGARRSWTAQKGWQPGCGRGRTAAERR